MREMGTPASQKANLADEGVLLDYFEDGDGNEEPLRAASGWYWTRSPSTANGDDVWAVAGSSGKCACRDVSYSYGVRPALILPQAMPVENGAVQPNGAPTITSASGVSGADLGTRNGPFSFEYIAADPEGSSLSLTESLDQTVTRTLTAPSGSTLRFEAVYDSLTFLKLDFKRMYRLVCIVFRFIYSPIHNRTYKRECKPIFLVCARKIGKMRTYYAYTVKKCCNCSNRQYNGKSRDRKTHISL